MTSHGSGVTVAAPRSDSDWEQFSRVQAQAFALPAERIERHLALLRPGTIPRFAFDGDRVIGGALGFPCEQLVGGRPVTSGGVAAVCVLPELRGGGVGRAIVAGLVDALREDGRAVSSLWPSSVSFYRDLGWEVAGTVAQHSVAATALRGTPIDGTAERDPPTGEMRAVRSRAARSWTGPVERPDWWWRWQLPERPPDLSYRYGWREDGALTGYVVYAQRESVDRVWGFDTWVSEFWATTSGARNGLARLLSGDAPMSPRINFDYGVLPHDADLLWQLPDGGLRVHDTNAWMFGVFEPVGALEQAGWPPHIRAHLQIEVAGIGQKPRQLVVDVADGRAHAAAGGPPAVRLSPNGFAAWYVGALSASRVAALGLGSGPGEDLATMDALTADRTPWLPDMF